MLKHHFAFALLLFAGEAFGFADTLYNKSLIYLADSSNVEMLPMAKVDTIITDTLRMKPVEVVQSNQNSILGLKNRELSQIPQAELGVQIADQLGDIPGVSVSNMGPGLTRPVIRGFSGSRVAVVIDGLRMDNQQWQDEHGLAIGSFPNDKLSVVLGPSAILAGGDAMGGLVQIETVIPQKMGIYQQSNLRFFSNNLGLQLGYQRELVKLNHSKWFGILCNQFGDYHESNGSAVLNTRNDGFQVKWGSFQNLGRSQIWMNYRSSINRTGISRSLDSLEKIELLNANPREFEAPHHLVMMHAFSYTSRTKCNRGYQDLQFGLQSNTRLEIEEGELDGLAMQLNTAQQRFFKTIELESKWIISLVELLSFQNNFNIGQVHVIPNYINSDGGIHGVLQRSFGKMDGSLNLGMISKIYLLKNQSIAALLRPICGFSTLFHHSKFFSTRFSISQGSRNPNFHELYANGISEDAFRFDNGNSALKSENILNFELCNEMNFNRLKGNVNLIYSKCNGFISLLPTGKLKYGAPEFQFMANDAIIKGMEGSIHYCNLSRSINFQLNASIISIYSNGSNIQFLPPFKLGDKIQIQIFQHKKDVQLFAFAGTTYFRTLYPDIYTRKNESFWLASLGFNYEIGNLKLQINSTNLFNQRYVDPMSFLKIIPYRAPGRSINFSVNYLF